MADYGDVELGAWLAALADRSPAPGGGPACAVALAMAAALSSMVARYSGDLTEDAQASAEASEKVRFGALELAGADEAAYGAVLSASRHSTAPASTGRGALAEATRVPLHIVSLGADLASVLVHLAVAGNPRLRGDAWVALELLKASTSGAASLVRLNAEGLAGVERSRLLEELRANEARLGTQLAPLASLPPNLHA